MGSGTFHPPGTSPRTVVSGTFPRGIIYAVASTEIEDTVVEAAERARADVRRGLRPSMTTCRR